MPDEIIETSFGKFLIDPRDCIGSTLKAGTLWDGPGFLQPLALEYAAFGEQGATILDIGANIGSFSIWCAYQGAWRVIAVEPIPLTLRYLAANLDLNKEVCADRVLTLALAAYDKTGILQAQGGLDSSNLGSTALSPHLREDSSDPLVIAYPLDSMAWMFGKRVSLIKIDAQGSDGAVLRGLEQTLKRDHPAIIFEWEEDLASVHGYDLPGTLTWLGMLNYAVHPWPSHPSNYLATYKPPPAEWLD